MKRLTCGAFALVVVFAGLSIDATTAGSATCDELIRRPDEPLPPFCQITEDADPLGSDSAVTPCSWISNSECEALPFLVTSFECTSWLALWIP